MATIRLYTKNHCPYCDSAKRLFKRLGLEYVEENLESNPTKRQELSQRAGGYRTMPMIWVGEEFIGGFSDVQALHDRGELLAKVQS
jgi:glutaredoxin 3